MRLSKQRKKKAHAMSLTSAMADMALLLLIFFMTATSMTPQKPEDINLPLGNADNINQNHIYVGINKKQKIVLNGKIISLAEFESFLTSDDRVFEKKIVIMADQNLPFVAVSDILDVVKSLDLRDVVFISQPDE